MTTDRSTSLADKMFPKQKEQEIEILNIPPEERKLSTETYDFTVSTINEYINDDHIVIPKFQRGYVWNRAQASRLIESLIIQCPIPVIFLSQNSDESLAVIDGNQRLNSINLFLKDDFQLRGLTTYPELEGFFFSELDPRLQRHITNRTIRCIVILKGTHPQIKFDVFERLNTGSVKLNMQELRHGIYGGPLMDLVENLAKDTKLRALTGIRNDKRMKGDELVLRFLALAEDWRNYSKPMSSFINLFTENNRFAKKELLDKFALSFNNSLTICEILFGTFSFKTFNKEFKQLKFNAALFDAQMVAVFNSGLTIDGTYNIDREHLYNRLRELILDEEFLKYISSGTTDKKSVQTRIRSFSNLLSES